MQKSGIGSLQTSPWVGVCFVGISEKTAAEAGAPGLFVKHIIRNAFTSEKFNWPFGRKLGMLRFSMFQFRAMMHPFWLC
jgi:hypothetical protein